MLKLLLLILPAYLFAGEVFITTHYKNFKTNYTVEDPNRTLKSKLVFPHTAQTFGLGYKKDYKDYSFQISSQFLLYQNRAKGEDFDWMDNELTVYSSSNDKLIQYINLEISGLKQLSISWAFAGKFHYYKSSEHWSDTKQLDYVQNQITTINSNSLEFSQEQFRYTLGMNYSKQFSQELKLTIEPTFVYAYVETQDRHILRNFYVSQYCHAYGYNLYLSLNKTLNDISSLGVNLEYTRLEDKNTKMYYKTITTDQQYAAYPSSYQYKEISLGIKYNYKF